MTHVRHLQTVTRQGAAKRGAVSAASRETRETKHAAPSEAKRNKRSKRGEKAAKEPAKPEWTPQEQLLLARIRETGSAHHVKFGQGEVVHLDEHTIHVRFEAGVKKLLLEACLKMELLTPV